MSFVACAIMQSALEMYSRPRTPSEEVFLEILRTRREPELCDHCKREPDIGQKEFICRGCGAPLKARQVKTITTAFK